MSGLVLAEAPEAAWSLRASVPADGSWVRPIASAASAASEWPGTPWYRLPLTPRNGFLVLHLLGLCVGFGSTLLLDAWLIRWMVTGRLPRHFGPLFGVLGKAVAVGLALLWISGIGFLALYWTSDPVKLLNAKVHAKLVVVAILTLNGLFLHRRILPLALGDVTRPLFLHASLGLRFAATASGALSGTSWLVAFLLGLFRELNGKVTVEAVLTVWAFGVLLAGLVATLLLSVGRSPEADPLLRGPAGSSWRGRPAAYGDVGPGGRPIKRREPTYS